MKKIGYILLSILLSLSACKKSDTFTLNATVNGIEDGKNVFIQKLDENNRPFTIDTLKVKDGKFSYTGTKEIPEMNYLIIESLRGNIPVILEPGNIRLTVYKDSLRASIAEGTPSNDDFKVLMNTFKKIGEKNNTIRTQILKARQEKDSAAMITLRDELIAAQQASTDTQNNFIKENPQSYISVLLLKQRVFTERNLDITEAQLLYDAMSDDVKATQEAKEVAEKLQNMSKTVIGATAPDFSGPDPEGNTLSLQEVKGEVTIIDFWAAWCKPCRAENPNLVALYNKYHDKGLNIIGVSLDKTAEAWKKAIADDGLPWYHISHVKYWQDPIAKAYNIRAIPATFVLDNEGKIIARDLRGEALENEIARLLQPSVP